MEKKLATDKKANVDKILISLGLPTDILSWFEEDDNNYQYAPIDEETRRTLDDMQKKKSKKTYKLKDFLLVKEDFSALKQLALDLRTVYEIGREIWKCRRDLDFSIAKEDFGTAMSMKETIRKLEKKRDTFDAYYETTRYEEMIILNKPDSDYDLMQKMWEEERDAEARRRQLELEEQERRRILEEEQRRRGMEIHGDPNLTPWWEKIEKQPELKKKKILKKEKISELDETGFNFKNPFHFNEGDVDLDPHLRPLLANVGEKLQEVSVETLRHYHSQGILTVFGAKIWTAINGDNWRHREAAAQAVLAFIELPLPEKYLNGKSKRLFLACMEFAKMACQDKILQIYFLGLKILSTALAPPICGTDVSPALINTKLKEFLPVLIEKISELNFRLFTPIDKQQWRFVLSRLEIILNVVQEFGIDESEWSWRSVFELLITPSLFHSNAEVRLAAIELLVAIYQLIGEEVRTAVIDIENLKPNLKIQILARLDEVQEIAEKNKKNREIEGDLPVVNEENENPDYSKDNSPIRKNVSNEFLNLSQNNSQFMNKNNNSNTNLSNSKENIQIPNTNISTNLNNNEINVNNNTSNNNPNTSQNSNKSEPPKKKKKFFGLF